MVDRRILRLAALALLACALLLIDFELALTLAPALLLTAVPLSGWFVGERLIVARREVRQPHRRRVQSHWVTGREVAFASVLGCGSCSRRGPPLTA
jgi:hypothetical protein